MTRRTVIGRLLPATEAAVPTAELRRLRKMGVLLLMVIVVCAITAAGQMLQGAWRSALATGSVGVVALFGLGLLRRGAPLGFVTPLVIGWGLLLASLLAMGAGRAGMVSIYWMSLAPLIAMAVGGRTAGWWTLALTIASTCASLTGINEGWFDGFIGAERRLSNQMLSMVGAIFTGFMLTRAYENETEASIRELERQNQALHDAQSAAHRASRAKSDFLATISHEIRTPLNGVTGMATLLREEQDPARMREGLRVIQQSADTLLAVINDVLDLSKIESDRLELESVPVSPAGELQVVVDLLQTRAAEKHNELELTIASDVPKWMLGDPTRLRQVAMNLVSNAVKFTSEGRVSVRLSVRQGSLAMDVIDTGIGLSAEARARLFQPFAQADASTTRKFGGSGLGLVISRRLVEAMGGTLDVVSTLGEGSTFTVLMPFTVVDAPSAAVSPTVSAAQPARRVLVVEDNFVNQVVASRLLEKLGHQVTVVGDGAQAVALCGTTAFDLVLMDCHMPVMDGFEATRKLRENGCRSPIYALTAAVTTEDRDRCLQVGMTGVLSKPLRLDRLVEVLHDELRSSPAAA